MIKCHNCRQPVPADDAYCEHCGAQLTGQSRSPRPQTTVPESRLRLPPSLGSWRTIRWVIGFIVAVYLLGGLCGWLVFPREVVSSQVQVVTATSIGTPTNTPGPSPTPMPTQTPTLTLTPSPTNTPTPVPPTTVPGTILSPGQTWREDCLALRMELVAIQPEAVVIDLVLANTCDETIIFEVAPGMFQVVDNLGAIIGPRRNSYGRFAINSGFIGGGQLIEPGETLDLAKNAPFRHNLASAEITDVTVTVSGLSRIDQARWRVTIPH